MVKRAIERGYDIMGNVAIVKFDRKAKAGQKKKIALDLLRKHGSLKTVLEKTGKFGGRLRIQKTKYLAGERSKEAFYKENGCEFRFNVDSCYFSPRLSSERKEIALMTSKGERVLVLFGGVAPFAIIIAKLSKADKVVSVELGRDCNKYALENVRRNKLWNRVEIVNGDVRKKLPNMKENTKKSSIFGASKTKSFEGFDRIIMARPNLTDSFLDVTFPKIKKNGIIHYYGFYEIEDVEGKENKLKELLIDEARKAGRKIKIIRIKRAGDIGIRKYRYRADFRVLN